MVKIKLVDVLMKGYDAECFEGEEMEIQDVPGIYINEEESVERVSLARDSYRVKSMLFVANSPAFLIELVSVTYVNPPWKLIGIAQLTGKPLVTIDAGVMDLPEQQLTISLPQIPHNTKQYVLIKGRMYAVKEVLYLQHNPAACCIFDCCYPKNYFFNILQMYQPEGVALLAPFLHA